MPNQATPVKVRIDLSPDDSPGPDWDYLVIDDARNEGPFVSITIVY